MYVLRLFGRYLHSLITTAGGLPCPKWSMIHVHFMNIPWHKVTQQNDGARVPIKGLGIWNKIENLDSSRSARSAAAATGLLMLALTQWHNFRISGHSCRVLWFFSLIGMLVVQAQVTSHRSLSFLFSLEWVNMSALLTHDSGSMKF